MEIAVFGAGSVGCVTAACLAAFGHRVWLVESSAEKLALLRGGRWPVFEPGLDDEFGDYLTSGRVVPGDSVEKAVSESELALVCVGTPGQADGSPDVAHVRRVLTQIADAAVGSSESYVIVLRSTVPYARISTDVIPVLAARLGDRFGRDIAFAVNPEFLREGEAIEDFRHPPFVVVGTEHELAVKKLSELYQSIEAPFHVVSPGNASLLKYACNAFHALKVVFANEIASMEAAFGADTNVVMEIFCLDRALNLSQAYLRPGFAFGGPCLGKDLRALNWVASLVGASCPVLGSVLRSNEMMVQRAVDAVGSLGVQAATLVGLSFKIGSDDLRESPLVGLAEELLQRRYRVRVYDPDVRVEALRGQNLDCVNERLGDLSSLLGERPQDVLAGSPLVVIGKMNLSKDQLVAFCDPATWVLDLTRQLPRILPPLRVVHIDDPIEA